MPTDFADSAGVQAELAAIRGRLDSLEAMGATIIALLQGRDRRTSSGPYSVEENLLRQIADELGDADFTVQSLAEHARIADPSLGRAITDAVKDRGGTAASLGKLFQRIEGMNLDGLTVVSLRRTRDGNLWQVRAL